MKPIRCPKCNALLVIRHVDKFGIAILRCPEGGYKCWYSTRCELIGALPGSQPIVFKIPTDTTVLEFVGTWRAKHDQVIKALCKLHNVELIPIKRDIPRTTK